MQIIDHVVPLFKKVSKEEIPKDAVFEILVEIAHGREVDYSKYKTISDKEINKIVVEVIKKNKDAPLNAIIGIVMGQIRGKASGKKIVEIVQKEYNK